MKRPRPQVTRFALCGLASIAFCFATGGCAPALAGSCWGCAEYACTSGHEAGGYLCEVGDIDCSLAAKVFFGCKSRWCKTKEPCPRPAPQVNPLEPKVGPSPGDPEHTMSEDVPASPAIAPTHPTPWQPAATGAPLP